MLTGAPSSTLSAPQVSRNGHVRTISSRQNPLVAAFRSLAAEPDPAGVRVLLDGAHLVGEALDAGVILDTILVASSRLHGSSEEGRLARALESRGLDVAEAGEQVFDAVSPVRSPSGIAAIGRRTPTDGSTMCAAEDAFVLAVLDVQDPGNVGALLRSAEAGGVTGVFVSGSSANPFSWKALRGSMGSALRLPVVTGVSAEDAFEAMRRVGMRTVASVAQGGGDPDAADWRGRIGLWIGSEGQGLPDEIAARCEAQVTIPMAPRVESLNAAVAAGILVYAARRRRLEAGTGLKGDTAVSEVKRRSS